MKKLNKKIVSIAGIATLVPASIAGVGVGIWYSQPKIKYLSTLINKKDLGPINESDKTIQNLLKLIKQKNPSLDINKVELEIKENKAIVKPKTGEKSYKGQVEITFTLVNIDLTNLIKETNLGAINETDLDDTNKLIELIRQKNPSINLDFSKLDLEINRDSKTVIVNPKTGDNTYKGDVSLNFVFKTKINEIEGLNTNAGILNSNSSDVIISKFIENNKDKLQNLTKDDFNVVSNTNGKLTITVKADNTQYQGSVEISYSVRDQLNTIEKIVKDVNNLKNNDDQSVLERFYELNKTLFEEENIKITKNQLKAQVNDDIATITIDGNDKYQGSVDVKLSLSKQTGDYLDVIPNDDQSSVLKAVNDLNKWNLDSNDLNIEVKGNTATITGKTEKNKKFIGTITAQFGLNANYKNNKTELTRIGFFKNKAGEWQMEKVDALTSKVVSTLPRFITSLKYVFLENRNEKIEGIQHWNTENITDMKHLFSKAKSFNQYIGRWNTENVKNMEGMFYEANKFNHDISRWNTSNVTTMEYMFYNAYDFNQPIGGWNTEKVTNMSSMFAQAKKFDQAISGWNVSNVTNMSGMFNNAHEFNQYIGRWNTKNVNNMKYMFARALKFNQNISDWNTSKVTNMEGMFEFTETFNQNISSWDTKNVTNMRSMFASALKFNQNISDWNVGNVKEYKDFNVNGVMRQSNIPPKFI
ncbi:BspA family leucine-rich repeat surface protein [Mycoplasma yeatsii]|uniref:Surface protein n=1 Tax=Mycoplasma yeatsii TaxID=51365 RepID=A0ABU0ND64_9MOLU|nr:BspA family leucine-rich repeat surface protein [Mycoplasma yeatsii]MDQ0567385.1 surface protein [Mycoplasma yeatsii]